MEEADEVLYILVPAPLLQRAIEILGKVPSEVSAHVYVGLLSCEPENKKVIEVLKEKEGII